MPLWQSLNGIREPLKDTLSLNVLPTSSDFLLGVTHECEFHQVISLLLLQRRLITAFLTWKCKWKYIVLLQYRFVISITDL